MAWEHLSINKPHLVYIILGGFTSLFMLCSSIIKERLYIGEATVATICGIIFGPHAADLIDPGTWGNTDQITLEFSRIVLVVQCFAVGVELPKAYMERHWRSVTFLLVPVMTFGWLVTSLFIWALFRNHLNWLDSLCIAACVTATDPVLASSVVGKGKFAKRVPKHLRDLLSAESGCNDGMAFPFIYLAIYIIRYHHHPNEVALHWFCYTILYECIFGCFYGVMVGYIARRLIRAAHERDMIDRESFLVFYFVLALFCAGSGSLLGMDDLLVGFACGVGFSNDGWFLEKTEESHVSNVIDLLINLAFFVYFGTIIPWQQYNSGFLGLDVWRLVVISLLVLFFRRIPIMLALKPVIPDIKTWREALFAGHFGPIGVGAIFVAILARAELETEETTPLAVLPGPDFPHDNIIELIWPITTFLVMVSIVVHGSSIAVFTLGKHINTLTLTMSYTQANEQGWMDRLPRIASRSKSQGLSQADSEYDEKNVGVGAPIGAPGTFLRRQKEEDNPSRGGSRSNSKTRSRKSKKWDSGFGPGGPISQTAIKPASRQQEKEALEQPSSRSDSDTIAANKESPHDSMEKEKFGQKEDIEDPDRRDDAASPGEIYEEGDETVYEDEEGNVLAVEPTRGEAGPEREADERREGRRLMREESADQTEGVATTKTESAQDYFDNVGHGAQKFADGVQDAVEKPGKKWRQGMERMGSFAFPRRKSEAPPKPKEEKRTSGPARAYQYGNTIIVEDEDGEVIKKYDIPGPDRKQSTAEANTSRQRMNRMGKMLGLSTGGGEADSGAAGASGTASAAKPGEGEVGVDDDERLRFTINTGSGRRMSKAEFIDQIRGMDPKARVQAVEESDAPEAVKQEARKDMREQMRGLRRRMTSSAQVPTVAERPEAESAAEVERVNSHDSNELKLVTSNEEQIPFHDVSSQLQQYSMQSSTGETAAERRRRQALQRPQEDDSDDDGTERMPPSESGGQHQRATSEAAETAAERRRRLGALGHSNENDSESSEDEGPREVPQRQGIRFADQPAVQQPQPEPEAPARQSTLKWGKNKGR